MINPFEVSSLPSGGIGLSVLPAATASFSADPDSSGAIGVLIQPRATASFIPSVDSAGSAKLAVIVQAKTPFVASGWPSGTASLSVFAHAAVPMIADVITDGVALVSIVPSGTVSLVASTGVPGKAAITVVHPADAGFILDVANVGSALIQIGPAPISDVSFDATVVSTGIINLAISSPDRAQPTFTVDSTVGNAILTIIETDPNAGSGSSSFVGATRIGNIMGVMFGAEALTTVPSVWYVGLLDESGLELTDANYARVGILPGSNDWQVFTSTFEVGGVSFGDVTGVENKNAIAFSAPSVSYSVGYLSLSAGPSASSEEIFRIKLSTAVSFSPSVAPSIDPGGIRVGTEHWQ